MKDNMNLYQCKKLEYLRVFIQDGANSWNVADDLKVNNSILYSTIQGDINGDDVFNIADIVTLQKWLLNDGTALTNWKAGDLFEDSILNVFDLCLMK